MPISRTDQLKSLVRSLTKAEKKNFRLYARRIQSSDGLMYLELFDVLEKDGSLSDQEIIAQMGDITKSQYSNLKRHLYTQLLVILRLLHKNKQVHVRIREHIDFAYVLYGKGLHLQSLKLLDKAKDLAKQSHDDFALLTIVEIEKTIESRHITRSGAAITESLIDTSEELLAGINDYVSLSSLRIQLHGIYVKHGHVKNALMHDEVVAKYHPLLESIEPASLGPMHRVFLSQCFVWYYYILQDFEKCVDSANEWVGTFNKNPQLKTRDVDLYMRGYHYLLTALYYRRDKESFDRVIAEIETFRKENYKKFNKNSQIISFLYVHLGRLNKHFLHGSYSEGLMVIPRTLRRIRRYEAQLDAHRILVFYYKIAWMYLGAGQSDMAVKYISRVINLNAKSLREDIQGYSRLMLLMAHYDLENYDILEYLIKQFERFFESVKEQNNVYRLCIGMIGTLIRVTEKEQREVLLKFRSEFEALEQNPYEQRTFLYLDIVPWINSQLRGVSIEGL